MKKAVDFCVGWYGYEARVFKAERCKIKGTLRNYESATTAFG